MAVSNGFTSVYALINPCRAIRDDQTPAILQKVMRHTDTFLELFLQVCLFGPMKVGVEIIVEGNSGILKVRMGWWVLMIKGIVQQFVDGKRVSVPICSAMY